MSIVLKIARNLGAALLLFTASSSVHAVIDVGYQQDEPGEVRTITNDDSSTTTSTTTGGSFIVDTNYALIINPNDAEGYQGVTHSNTKAYRIMTYLFGTMDRSQYGGLICAPPNPCSALMGSLFSILNSGILTLGMVFLGYTITNSAFSDAAQGTALGQKFSPQEVALRSAIGLGFLLPTSTGYSVIQIAIVKFILLGSSAGTGLWQYIVDYRYAANEAIGSAHLYDGQDIAALGGEKAAEDFISQFADIETCVLYQNHSITNPDNWVVSELYTDSTGNTSVRTGTPQSEEGAYNNTCGQMTLGQLGNSEYDIVVQYIGQVRTIAALMVQDYFAPPENSIDDVTLYQNQYFILKDMMRLDLEILTLDDKKKEASEYEFNADISQSEWLDIPGYFFQFLTTPGHDVSVDFNSSMSNEPNFTYSSSTLHSYYAEATNWNGADPNSDGWRQEADQSNRTNMSIDFGTLDMLKADGSYEVTKNLKEMFESVTRYQDPLVGLAAYGRQWLEVAMQVMITAYVFSLLVAVATGIASDYVGMSQMGIGMAVVGLISAVLQAFGAIIPIASMFAIGLPMMPLILFSSAIIAWIIYTIAAVMSGPIIAIGLISPGAGLGKAAPAMMLLLNLFLRPSLHVIGLVAGAKLFNIAFIYFTQAFLTTVYQIFEVTSLPSDGMLMSLTSIIFLYAYTFAISALCSRCYSLITAIPDKVFMWVGGAPMGLPDPVAQASRTALQRSASHTEQKAGEMSKGIDEFVNQKFKEAKKKIKKRNKEGKKPRSAREDLANMGGRAIDVVARAGNALNNFDMRGALNNINRGAARGVHNARNFFGGAYTPEVAASRQAVRRAERELGLARAGQFLASVGGAALGYKAPDVSVAKQALETAKKTRELAKLSYEASEHSKVRTELAEASQKSRQAHQQFEVAKTEFLATGQSLENIMRTSGGNFDNIKTAKAAFTLRNAYRLMVEAQLKEHAAISSFTNQLHSGAVSNNGKVSAVFNDAGTYYKRSTKMLLEIDATLKNSKIMGASDETITRIQACKTDASQTHTALRGVLSQNMASLSGFNQLRLGLGERFDNIWKTTTPKLQTFDFHTQSKRFGLGSGFGATAEDEQKYMSIKKQFREVDYIQKTYSLLYSEKPIIFEPNEFTFISRQMLHRENTGFKDAANYHKKSNEILLEIESTLKKAKLMGASNEDIKKLQDVKENASQIHIELRKLLSQNMASLSGFNQLRLGLGERFDNIWKTTQDPDADAAEKRPSPDARKLQTFDFHKDPKKSGIVSSFVSRNYNRGMGRLMAYGEEKYTSIKVRLGYSDTLQKQYSQGYFARAKVAEQHFSENFDLNKLTFTQRVMLRHAEVGFNVAGSWKSIFGKTAEDKHSYSQKDSTINGIMRRDYQPTHNFKQLLRPSVEVPHKGPHNTAVPLTKAEAQAQEEKLQKETQKAEKTAAKEQERKAKLENAYQGKERRQLRDARQEVVKKRNELLATGMSYAEAKKDPEFIQKMADLKKAEVAIDGYNFVATGLRSFDRGLKEGSKWLGESSRLGLADLRKKWSAIKTDLKENPQATKVDSMKAAAGRVGLGLTIGVWTAADIVGRLTTTIAFKVPGSLFRPNQKIPRKKLLRYSDRSIFSLEQIEQRTDEKNPYNQFGISTDKQSVAQSFRDVAEVMTLGIYSSRPGSSGQPTLSTPITAQVSSEQGPRISDLTDTYSDSTLERSSGTELDANSSDIRSTITDPNLLVDESGAAYSNSDMPQQESGKLPVQDSYGQEDGEVRASMSESGVLRMSTASEQDDHSESGTEPSGSDGEKESDVPG